MAGLKQVVRIDRVLDMESAQRLKRQLNEILETQTGEVELDFTDTESIDSSGLGKLLLFNEKFKETGRKLKLSNVRHSKLIELFRLINLDKSISIDFRDLTGER